MIEATDTIKQALTELAHEASRAFCYADYIVVICARLKGSVLSTVMNG